MFIFMSKTKTEKTQFYFENKTPIDEGSIPYKKGNSWYVKIVDDEIPVFTLAALSHRRLKYANGVQVALDARLVQDNGRSYVIDPDTQTRVEVLTAAALNSSRYRRAKNKTTDTDDIASSPEGVDESVSSRSSAVAGISDKYQQERGLRLPKQVSAYDVGDDILSRFSSRLELIKLNARMLVEHDPPLATLPIEMHEGDLNIRLQLCTHNPSLRQDDKFIFIFSGRKEQAYIPQSMPGDERLRVVLVGPREDYEQLKDALQPGIDFLVIDELVSPTHGHFEKLGLLTCRRIAAFYCALHLQKQRGINHALMLDDNIRSIHVQDEGIASWDGLFDALAPKADEKQSLSVSLATLSNQGIRDVRPGELGSKFYLFDLKKLRAVLGDNEAQWLLPFPPQASSNFWGEDYYFQLMFEALGASASLKGYEVLEPAQYGIRRASLPSLCRTVVKTADTWCEARMETLFGAGLARLDAKSFSLINHMLDSFKKIIQDYVALHRARLQHSRTKDLMIAHAWANKVTHHPETR